MSAQRVQVERIGAERQPVVVIDDFAPDPAALRAIATQQAFAAMGRFYPGLRAPVTPAYFEGLGPALVPAIRQVFGHHGSANFSRALYSLTTTAPAQLSLAQRIPHIDDVAANQIAILHYLSPDDASGTAFFRHRSTGLESISAAQHEGYLAALTADFARHGPPPATYINGSTAIFEEIARFPARYNRALIYRANLLHCAALGATPRLSADPLTGRLTVASFVALE